MGRRLGHLDATGFLTLENAVPAALVPEAARTALWTSLRDGLRVPGLRLTLDLDLSALAHDSLGYARGSVVLLDPHTGGVLAAVSDPVTRSARPGATPAFEDRREPASISKIITAAAGLRAGLDVDDFLRHLECRGPERFGNGILWCSYPAGRLQGLDQAMAVSCNMAFAHIGVRVGRAALLDELHLWGFDRDFAIAPAGHVVAPSGDLRQLADLAIGLEASDITPLHGALLATVIANEGRMPEPALLEGTEGPMGLHTTPAPRLEARDVIAPEAVPVLARSMQAVTVYGTAAGAVPLGFPVAMKTGTGAEWRKGYHANYVGVAPWPNPVVAFSIRITHEPTSSRVNRTAREVLVALLEGLKLRSTSLRGEGRLEERLHPLL
jgi:peptidoglycan glycosyltransferase